MWNSMWSRSSSIKSKNKALGEIVHTRVTHGGKKLKVSPEQHFVKICYDELVGIMGPVDTSLKLTGRAVSAVMMVGLQGSGKTTTTRQSSHGSSRKWARSP
ncbi:MAG: hypothetical protein MZU79_00110 [Anaerotruncus sp.]|nr:hypothetical protein [Anaerotruncus sp.]